MSGQTRGPWVDHSITLNSGSSQTLITSDPNRQGLIIHNPSSGSSIGVSILGTAATNTAGTMMINPTGTILLDIGIVTNAWNVIGTSGQGVTVYTYP